MGLQFARSSSSPFVEQDGGALFPALWYPFVEETDVEKVCQLVVVYSLPHMVWGPGLD